MAVTGTRTVQDIVTAALRKIGVADAVEPVAAHDMELGREQLDRMLKAWQNRGYNLWTYTAEPLTLTTAASYTLTTVRPLRILSARYKPTAAGTETAMMPLSREEYDALPLKTATGTPTCYHYDRQAEAAKIYIWPVLAAATTQTIQLTIERETTDADDINNVVDLPGEWWDAAVYGLADRLMDDFGVGNRRNVTARAQQLLDEALAGDHEDSVYFFGTL